MTVRADLASPEPGTHPRSPDHLDPGLDHPAAPSPLALMRWAGLRLADTIGAAVVCGVVWMLSQALVPAAIGRAVDRGLVPGDTRALVQWSLVVLGLGLIAAVSGTLRHRYAVFNYLRAALGLGRVVAHHATGAGPALTRVKPLGEVIAAVDSDAHRMGGAFDVIGRFAGAIVSYLVVGAILLTMNVRLGVLVLLGVPALVALLSFVVRPLQRRQADQREESGRLIALGADTVGGLRVLRGIGGEQTFLHRYETQSQAVRMAGVRVAGLQATLDAAQVLLPGVFVVIVTWAGARAALAGEITPGEVVQLYGYAAFLVIPLRTAIEMADKLTRAHVAAGKISALLAIASDTTAGPASPAVGQPAAATNPTTRPRAGGDTGGVLADPASGLVVQPGLMTALVSEDPTRSAAVIDRLGRFGPGRSEATLDGTPVAEVPVDQLRQRVTVAENDGRLFSGVLRDELDVHGGHTDDEILAALAVASGEDLLDAFADGLDTEVEERGRSFSGGQRQRLVLARALLLEPEALLLVEPTSAVDAHTEARIAERLHAARAGRTTVLTTASPLMLERADVVTLLVDGRVAATGRHRELLHTTPAYREVVTRGEDA